MTSQTKVVGLPTHEIPGAAHFFIPTLALSQELHIFNNGKVVDANKINETHQYLLENASGGCSATQQDNSVLIQCVLLVLPQFKLHETPPAVSCRIGVRHPVNCPDG